ncbi:type II secretion system F family protein [Pantoea sp. Tr-811]|uniref:type II secretion system F family protein n=1 Tax=unclassified Pantoea TaxID=2630326 RepID=UPI00142454CD|nr:MULTISPECIES: type II secretion system F family protein [unclassified Pantoea]NIE73208.1 type II secretion system F family protein [Pantoea sp. Ap-967]NIF29784.1 type II secretion system F family protein [Pantoea sp. Tr-811]
MTPWLDDPFVLTALGLLCCGLGMALIGLHRRQRQPVLRERLTRDSSAVQAQADILRDQALQVPQQLQALAQASARVGEQLAGAERDRRKLRELLTLAGLRQREALGLLVLGKYLLGLLLASLVLLAGFDSGQRLTLNGMTAALIALFVGTLLPELWLKARAARRGGRLERSLPDALDLMVICAEAGLPLGRILQVVAKELALSAPEMAEELRYTCAELQLVSDRAKALQHFAERTGVSGIESMVSTLIQAERYGTPLSHALRTISDESRKTLVLTLEERAGKLPAQLSVPLMTLILPPIIAMMGAPALVRIVRLLTH